MRKAFLCFLVLLTCFIVTHEVRAGFSGGTSSSGSAAWGSITGNISSQTDLQSSLSGKVSTTGNETISGTKTFSSTISGNASTATALASNPSDCSSNQFASAIAANGNLTCSAGAAGPGTSTDNAIATWNGTDGYTLRNTNFTISNTARLTSTSTFMDFYIGSTPVATFGRASGTDNNFYIRTRWDSGSDTYNYFGGTNKINTTQTGNAAAAGDQNLISYSIPAGSVGADGRRVEVKSFGTTANSANTKVIKLKYGATTLITCGTISASAAYTWEITSTIIRTGATSQKAITKCLTNDLTSLTTAHNVSYTTPAETLSGAVVLVTTCDDSGDAANGCLQEGLTVMVHDAGN